MIERTMGRDENVCFQKSPMDKIEIVCKMLME